MSIEKIIASVPSATREKREGMRRNALDKLDSPNAPLRADAERLLAALESQEIGEQAELIAELTDLSIVDRVVRAFTVKPLTETEAKAVKALLDNPEQTSTQLSRLAGWEGKIWHRFFGGMCADRAIYLWPAPPAEKRDGKFYSGILADLQEPENLFTMKPEAVAAFARLGLKGRS